MHPFTFNPETATNVILYIAQRAPIPDFHHISKISYFADRKHLERYGRFICGDRYIAMKDGPVPSGIYDILKTVRGDGWCLWDDKGNQDYGFSVADDGFTVKPHRDADLDDFSESDIECLDDAIKQYGKMPFSQLCTLSHQGAWQKAAQDNSIAIEHIIADLANSEQLMEYIKAPYWPRLKA